MFSAFVNCTYTAAYANYALLILRELLGICLYYSTRQHKLSCGYVVQRALQSKPVLVKYLSSARSVLSSILEEQFMFMRRNEITIIWVICNRCYDNGIKKTHIRASCIASFVISSSFTVLLCLWYTAIRNHRVSWKYSSNARTIHCTWNSNDMTDGSQQRDYKVIKPMSVHMLFIRVHYNNTRYYEFANRFGNVI